MSLEELIAKHTEALTANTAAVSAHTAALKSLAGGKPAAGAAAGTKPAGTTKPKDISDEDLRTAVGDYISGAGEGERDARRAQVMKILAHVGVAKATEVPKPKRAEFMGYFETLKGGELPDFLQEEQSGGDGDDLLG